MVPVDGGDGHMDIDWQPVDHYPAATREMIDAACRAYFVDNELQRPEADVPDAPADRIGVH